MSIPSEEKNQLGERMNMALKDGDLNFSHRGEGHTEFFFLMKQGIYRKRAYRYLGRLPAMSQGENLCGRWEYMHP